MSERSLLTSMTNFAFFRRKLESVLLAGETNLKTIALLGCHLRLQQAEVPSVFAERSYSAVLLFFQVYNKIKSCIKFIASCIAIVLK